MDERKPLAAGPRLDPSYDSWANNTLPTYTVGQTFEPTDLALVPGHTSAPPLLSETDLLQKMENHQIGTDATQAQHIEKVVGERGYAMKVVGPATYFLPRYRQAL